MSGGTNLEALLRGMTPVLLPEVYVFATVDTVPDGLAPRMTFQEEEGTTLIVTRAQAEAHGVAFEFPARMITLNVHSALDAVGFIALIATKLAAQDMGVNPVAGFYHDHLFIPEDRAEDAMAVLHKIAAGEA